MFLFEKNIQFRIAKNVSFISWFGVSVNLEWIGNINKEIQFCRKGTFTIILLIDLSLQYSSGVTKCENNNENISKMGTLILLIIPKLRV